jgi:hypothetical protein
VRLHDLIQIWRGEGKRRGVLFEVGINGYLRPHGYGGTVGQGSLTRAPRRLQSACWTLHAAGPMHLQLDCLLQRQGTTSSGEYFDHTNPPFEYSAKASLSLAPEHGIQFLPRPHCLRSSVAIWIKRMPWGRTEFTLLHHGRLGAGSAYSGPKVILLQC